MNQGVEMQKNKKQFYITELNMGDDGLESTTDYACLLYTSPSPRDATLSRMPASA